MGKIIDEFFLSVNRITMGKWFDIEAFAILDWAIGKERCESRRG